MKIAILTSGGDSPGMNACVRAAVRYCLEEGHDIFGIERGFQGIVENRIEQLTRRSVSNIIQRGGTFLETERCDAWLNRGTRLKGAETLRAHGIEGLIVIGGDGSFRGAAAFAKDSGMNIVGIPGTIDNDLAYTDYTLGFDTAVNNILWAINALRDTMQSHNKVSIVEVMGRRCGDLALHAGISGGAEYILVPEVPFDVKTIAEEVKASAEKGKKSNLILLAEGAGSMEDFAREFEAYSGISPRKTRLGHIQRGGSPTYRDRLLASRFGIAAVRCLLDGKSNRVIGTVGEKIVDLDIFDALSVPKEFDTALYREAGILT